MLAYSVVPRLSDTVLLRLINVWVTKATVSCHVPEVELEAPRRFELLAGPLSLDPLIYC